MKKLLCLTGLSLMVLVLVFSVVGCQGERGLVGPQGIQGEQGEQGATGATGEAGKDGISITWLGSHSYAPRHPDLNDAYYDKKDDTSYIWDGDDWTVLARDGEEGSKGDRGPRGYKGADGTFPYTMQMGTLEVTGGQVITFPTKFDTIPLVFVNVVASPSPVGNLSGKAILITTKSFTTSIMPADFFTATINWLAISLE